MDWETIVQLLFASFQTGSIYALVALSYVVILNATGILNFAQGECLMLGAMAGVALLVGARLPYPVMFVAAIAVVALLSVLSERMVVRPLVRRGAPLIALILVLLGVMMVFRHATGLILGKRPQFAEAPFGLEPIKLTSSLLILPQTIFIYLTVALVFLAIWFFFERTRVGMMVKIVGIDAEAARLVGVNMELVTVLAFAAGGAIAAIGGLLMAPLSAASFYMGLTPGVKGFVAMVIGGVGSPVGALLGGIVLALVETLAASYLSSAYADGIAFLVLLLMLFFRPAGIMGSLATGGR